MRSIPNDNLPNPRDISNAIGSFTPPIDNDSGLSISFTIFGQFLDHDVDLTEAQHRTPDNTVEEFNIPIPPGDPFFGQIPHLGFTRSQFIRGPGVRQFPNMITSWIDGSQVYGSGPL